MKYTSRRKMALKEDREEGARYTIYVDGVEYGYEDSYELARDVADDFSLDHETEVIDNTSGLVVYRPDDEEEEEKDELQRYTIAVDCEDRDSTDDYDEAIRIANDYISEGEENVEVIDNEKGEIIYSNEDADEDFNESHKRRGRSLRESRRHRGRMLRESHRGRMM